MKNSSLFRSNDSIPVFELHKKPFHTGLDSELSIHEVKSMGLSIHYNGRFNNQASLSEMIDEVKDVAGIYHWKYHIYETVFPDNTFDDDSYNDLIYGISFVPPESEPVFLCFLCNRRMSSPDHLIFFGNSEDEMYKKYLYMLSCKTQYAGSDVHKLIIHFLKYLSKKYLQEFEVVDEGYYWETGDEKLLETTFKKYTDLINSFGSALENIPLNSGETFEEYFERIMRIVQSKREK